MNLFDKVKHIPEGIEHLREWLGEGGQVVSKSEAQQRANICLTANNGKPCPKNVGGWEITKATALAIKAHLGLKNGLRLRVDGEKQLKTCAVCGCVLRLLIWQPQDMVRSQSEGEELPGYCWKLK